MNKSLKYFEVGCVYTIKPGTFPATSVVRFSTSVSDEIVHVVNGQGMLCVDSRAGAISLEVIFLTQDIDGKVVEVVADDTQTIRNFITRLL